MKKIVLLQEQLDKLLYEEMGISSSVKNVTKKIEELILSDGRNNNILLLNDFDFIDSVEIIYKCYNIKNTEEIYKILNNIGAYINANNAFIKNNKLSNISLNINFIKLNDKILSSYFHSYIMHEVNHMFKLYSKLLKNIKIDNSSIYIFSINNMNNDNHFLSDISRIIYYSDKEEQDSFISQLYNYILTNKNKIYNKNDIQNLYKQSESYSIYVYLCKLRKNINNWSENDEDYIYALKMLNEYGNFNKKFFIKLIDRIIKRYKIKIDKCLYKSMNDIGIKTEIKRIDMPLGVYTI